MHTLTFDDKERILLIEILESHLANLPHEVHKTAHRSYREMLEEKKSMLERLAQKLRES